jgi:uncharacterized hydrophobic protein (TIGR00271 family)
VLVLSSSTILLLAIFILLDDVSASAGPLAFLPLLLASLLVFANLLGYVALVKHGPYFGSAYAQVQGVRSGWLAFTTGWLLILAGLGACTLLAHGFAVQVSILLREYLSLSLPAWPWAAGAGFLVAISSGLGTRESRQGLFTLLLLVFILVIIVLIAIPNVRLDVYLTGQRDWIRPAAVLMAAFVGLEIAASFQSEMRNYTTEASRTLLLALVVAAGLGGLFFAVVTGVVAGEVLAVTEVPMSLLGTRLLGGAGKPVILGVGTLALALALNTTFMLVVRQLYGMSRDGYLPSFLHTLHPRLRTPMGSVILGGILLLLLVALPDPFVGPMTGLLYLLVLMGVNLALLLRQRQGDVPLPFSSWIPGVVVVVDGMAALLWGPLHLGTAAGLVALGTVLYLVYGRQHHIAERESVATAEVFLEQEQTYDYRILVPIANPTTARTLLHLAGAMARQKGGEVVALQVLVVPDQVPLEEGREQALSSLGMDQAREQARGEDFPIRTIVRVAHDVAEGILDTAHEEAVDLILLGWRGYSRSFGASMGPIIDRVIRDAERDVTVVKGDEWSEARKILVPTAGGPHAPIAAHLAMTLADTYGAEVTALNVQLGRSTASQMEESRERIASTLEGLDFKHPPEQRVIVAESVVEGIIQESKGYDLVLLGASEEGLFDQFVFGSIPQQIAARVPKTAVIVRRYSEPETRGLRRLLRRLFHLFPRLNVEEQLELREVISASAQPGVNYFVLIVLSSIIATLGLLLDSAAVVIGAMLVAPLMSPILGFSLGMVLGDVRLIRLSVGAIFKGVGLALILAVLLGFASPFKNLTGEIIGRTQPNLLDLTVALASGMAGAYALARKEVSAALPGVAIAAALMPPLAVAGIGLSLGEPQVAVGAFLLFLANIAAISLAGVLVFILLGVRSESWRSGSSRGMRRGLIGLILLILVIAVPLGVIVMGILRDTATQHTIEEVLEDHTRAHARELVDFEYRREEEHMVVIATVRSLEPVGQAEVEEIVAALGTSLDRAVRLEVITLPLTRAEWGREE